MIEKIFKTQKSLGRHLTCKLQTLVWYPELISYYIILVYTNIILELLFAITVSNGRPFPPLCDCYYMEILNMHLLRYGILSLLLFLSQISCNMCGRQLTNNSFKNQNVIASSNFVSSSHMFSQSMLLGFFILRQIHLFFFNWETILERRDCFFASLIKPCFIIWFYISCGVSRKGDILYCCFLCSWKTLFMKVREIVSIPYQKMKTVYFQTNIRVIEMTPSRNRLVKCSIEMLFVFAVFLAKLTFHFVMNINVWRLLLDTLWDVQWPVL